MEINPSNIDGLHYKSYILNERGDYKNSLQLSQACSKVYSSNIDCMKEAAFSLYSL